MTESKICECKIPKPITKCSENGIVTYCKNCLQDYKQKSTEMTESKQKAVELVEKFTTLKDAIHCVEELMYEVKYMTPDIRYRFWQEVLTHLKEML